MAKRVYVYRLDIEYPAGSHHESGLPVRDWTPPNWVSPNEGSTDPDADLSFRWPVERLFLSRSGAEHRVALLKEFGARVTIHRSDPVTWPEALRAYIEDQNQRAD